MPEVAELAPPSNGAAVVPLKTLRGAAPYQPSVELRRFVAVLLSEQAAGNKSEAQRITGFDADRFNYHFRVNPEFRAWYAAECDRYIETHDAMVGHSLMRKVKKGDTLAIRTFYEVRKKLRVNPSVNVDASQHLHQTYVWLEPSGAGATVLQPEAAAPSTNGNGHAPEDAEVANDSA